MAAIRRLTEDDKLNSSLNGLRQFLDSSTHPTAVTRPCGHLLLSNSEIVELLPAMQEVPSDDKIQLHELIAATADESRREAITGQLQEALRLASTLSIPESTVLQCSNSIFLHVTISPQIREDSQPLLLWIVQNVAKDHRMSERDEHFRKMQTLTRFAGGMAHEFNNLVTAILGNLELIRAQSDQPISSVVTNLDSAEVAALRTSALIQELRRFGAREVPLREPNSVARTIRRARRILAGSVPVNVEVTHSFDNEPELVALIDSEQLEETLLKLGVNSAEAIGVSKGRIHIYAGSFEDETGKPIVRIDISDTGDGMCEDTREHAFEPLFTTKDDAKAAGLGMSIAHGLIEEMGGYIRISDTSSQGSIVSIFLPRIDSTDDIEDDTSVGEQAAGLKIAILDTDRSVRNVVCGMLNLLGHTVSIFADGNDLLAAFTNGDRFDVVMINPVTSGMTGRTTFSKIREIDRDVPVVISSGSTINVSQFCNECESRPNAFLRKPFTMEQLACVLSSLASQVSE